MVHTTYQKLENHNVKLVFHNDSNGDMVAFAMINNACFFFMNGAFVSASIASPYYKR